MSASPETIRRTRTGYLRTSVRRVDGMVEVCRAPGDDRQDRLHFNSVAAAQLGLDPVGGRWVRPAVHGKELRFAVPDEASVATLMLAGLPTDAAGAMLAPLGAGLATAHRAPAAARPQPSGLRRLRRWLELGIGPGHAVRLHEVGGSAGMIPRLLELTEEIDAASESVLCLGAPGMNTVYPARSGRDVALLVTDELADARPEWDLGWCIGELLELENDHRVVPEPRTLGTHPTIRPFLSAYVSAGGQPDQHLLGVAAVLRWAVHLHDFCAYVDWVDDLDARLQRLGHFAAHPELVLA